ncbi:MAG: N-acetyltransferase family protein [Halolamina sp.]
MQVRPVATLREYRAAMAVNAVAWRDAYADLLPAEAFSDLGVPDAPTLRDRYETATADGGVFLVAVADDAPVVSDVADDDAVADTGVVGFAAFVWDPEATKAFVGDAAAGLRAIYVLPDRQGDGVGTALLAAGTDRLPPDRERVALEVFAANDDARGFYEARGFERVGASTFTVAGDDYETAVYARGTD